MNRALLSLAVVAALLASGVSDAQAQAAQKKLYRWVDKDGKVQFSDALPPEAVDQARTEFNAASGSTTAQVDRALTAEERVAKAEADRLQAIADKEAEQARKTEAAMIASFQNEEELRHSFTNRIDLLKQTLEAIEAGIASQRASLSSMLAEAAESELAGKAVPARQAQGIRGLHDEMVRQQQMLVLKQGELVELDAELLRLVERFRELKGAAPAAGDAAEATPPTG
ncbi:MAG TPA: DUF4124 domain-containing protein [Arenimonas sp.]|uniref:DUF4124 domain-containing protein n=1 Tax=Arenimonas sp. TaxID=1872635 RepID=UPI002D7FF813|nr:DUF4124 domain-containing protein [Arenimonas sp.]HEU0153202.1 DUF4124 domain-containing protein [Arenimonas sp.]